MLDMKNYKLISLVKIKTSHKFLNIRQMIQAEFDKDDNLNIYTLSDDGNESKLLKY